MPFLQKLPTFLYAMPFSPTCVFLEETSLVAKPAVPFPELKRRLDARMKHLGIKITKVDSCTLTYALPRSSSLCPVYLLGPCQDCRI